MKLLIVDNYDSFTYNLVHLFGALGVELSVLRNDDPALGEAAIEDSDAVVVGPGPGRPADAGKTLETIATAARSARPLLGVCLGQQAIAQHFGGAVVHAPSLVHGKTSRIAHDGSGVFAGLPAPFEATRYHSLCVTDLPDSLRVVATSGDGVVQGIEHHVLPIYGVQFHPESVLTPAGRQLAQNFIALAPAMSAASPFLRTVTARRDLSEQAMEEAVGAIVDGVWTPAQSGAFLGALAAKGESVDEVVGAARAMRARAVPVVHALSVVVDTCGTGGDGAATINVSTGAAFVVAACGLPVAKHGNRAASSLCGSADVLEALGIAIDADPEAAGASLKRDRFAFLFAQRYHPAMKAIAPVRRELGVRTIFNLLGPLSNPARATHQVVGVARADQVALMGEALERLGAVAGTVIHARNGMDEVAGNVPTDSYTFANGRVRQEAIVPSEVGIDVPAEALAGGDPAHNAAAMRSILAGERSPRSDVVALNAAVALLVADRAGSLAEGLQQAREALHSGAADAVYEAAKQNHGSTTRI